MMLLMPAVMRTGVQNVARSDTVRAEQAVRLDDEHDDDVAGEGGHSARRSLRSGDAYGGPADAR